MENASKALIMAAGVLIGILIISIGIYLFTDFGRTAAQINEQNAATQLTQFNSRFAVYESEEPKWTIYDIITVAGFARENNNYYENVSEYVVNVFLGNEDLTRLTSEDLIKNNIDYNTTKQYKCSIIGYHENGRISGLKFTE